GAIGFLSAGADGKPRGGGRAARGCAETGVAEEDVRETVVIAADEIGRFGDECDKASVGADRRRTAVAVRRRAEERQRNQDRLRSASRRGAGAGVLYKDLFDRIRRGGRVGRGSHEGDKASTSGDRRRMLCSGGNRTGSRAK